jgi:hypothetical protein
MHEFRKVLVKVYLLFGALVHILTRLLPLCKGFFGFSVKFFGDLSVFLQCRSDFGCG